MFPFLSLAKGTHFKVGVIEAGLYYPNEPKINIPGTVLFLLVAMYVHDHTLFQVCSVRLWEIRNSTGCI